MQAGDLRASLAYSRRAARNAERVFAHDEALKFLEQARESAEALQRADDAARNRRADRRHPRSRAARRIPPSRATSARWPASRMPRARAAIKAKIGSVYCAVGDPRGVPYLEQALAELDPRDADQRARARHRADGPLLPLSHRAPQGDRIARARAAAGRAARRSADSLSDHPNVPRGRASASARVRRVAIAGRGPASRSGSGRGFPVAIANGYEFLGENAAARGHWDEALAYGTKDREEGTQGRGAGARRVGASSASRRDCTARATLAEARAMTEEALALCEQIGEIRLATWLGPMAALDLRRPGRPRGRARDRGAQFRARRRDSSRCCSRRGPCTASATRRCTAAISPPPSMPTSATCRSCAKRRTASPSS